MPFNRGHFGQASDICLHDCDLFWQMKAPLPWFQKGREVIFLYERDTYNLLKLFTLGLLTTEK